MNDQDIQRINVLYRKMKAEGLTEEEKAEQAKLRSDYIAAIRTNLRGTINQVSIQNEDGSITPIPLKNKQ